MELRQIRYFVKVVELGSITRAALDMGIAQSAVSLQISQLESELSVRLLQRHPHGVSATDAGNAFLHEAYVILRHAERAIYNSQQSRLMGAVTVGFAPASTPVIGVPFLRTMHARYPGIRLQVVESLSGHLTSMLDSRQLDIALLFNPRRSIHWNATPLLEQKLYLISPRDAVHPHARTGRLSVRDIQDIPLLLPTATHGLRRMVDAACTRAGFQPRVVTEISAMAPAITNINAGKLRALGVTSSKRLETLPDVPTIAEAAVPGYESVAWYGLFAPAGTPAAIVRKIGEATAESLKDAGLRERLIQSGLIPVSSSPEEFRAFVAQETEKWGKVVKDNGITAE